MRHEQVSALAASADAKLTGRVQVCFGSAGPGATNLLTGLYDAREDHAPVVALIGQVPTTNMNYNYFQEFAENPMFEDVAVYNRTVMTAESFPYVVDEAVREAYKHKGVAVVVIPNNFGYVQIPDEPYSSSSPTGRKSAPLPLPTDEEVKNVLDLIKAAKRPVIHVSRGIGAGGEKLVELSKDINTVRTDFAALDSSALAQRLRDTNLDANAIGSFMQKPVELEQKSVYPVHNYGSAIAPFFTNIALWVGGFVLIAVMKIEVDASSLKAARRARKHKQAKSSFAAAVHTRVRNSEAFMGRWLLFALLGAAQGFVATVGDLIIGIQVEHPVAFVCAGMFASVVYVTVIMALAATLRHIGKALAVILVVMQVPGSSGTYPIEIMPPFFQALEPWLPFTYSINAMRETVAGYYGMEYTKNLGMLSLYLLGAFVLALAIRPYLLNLNALFDRRLAETDLLLSEETRDDGARFRLGSVVQMLMRHDEFARSLRRKAARFGALYPRLVSYGLVAIFAVPLLLLVLLFTVEAKIVFLMLWLLSVVVLDFYLISLEYIREVYERELGMSELSETALRTQVVSRVVRRWIRDDSDESDEEGDDEQ
ncbi:YhgE/Pip family protein [Alloscardovia omnicolens]|uniref:YhgE/Pip family protein n=1 Tax=Alloscardovia omnicolens TaxID=419015 RepID=UPI0037563F74